MWGKIAGYTCIGITYLSFGTAVYFFVIRLALRWARTNFLAVYPVISISARIAMAIWSHLCCWLGDPGFVEPSSNKHTETCKKCSAVKLERTHHCSTCNRCVERMDHHCMTVFISLYEYNVIGPWINQCVGIKNHKAFLLFLAYTCSAAVECLILVLVRILTCPSISDAVTLFVLRMVLGDERVDHLIDTTDTEDGRYAAMRSNETCNITMDYAVTGIIGIVIALLFTIFITFIATDQLYTLRTNQTHVEFLKGTKGPERTFKQACIETFGMEPSIWWLIPIDWRFSGKLLVNEKSKSE
jgi:hypothetical protein